MRLSNAKLPSRAVVPMNVLVEAVAADLGDVDSDVRMVTYDIALLATQREVVNALEALGLRRDWYQSLDWASASTNAPPPPDATATGYWEGVTFCGDRNQLVQAVAGAIRLARAAWWHVS